MGFLYPPPVQAPRPPWKEGQFFPYGLYFYSLSRGATAPVSNFAPQ